MKFILGQKIDMTQVFSPEGVMIPVTKVKAGPCFVIRKKTEAVDGYNALIIAYGEIKKTTKPLMKMFNQVSPQIYRFIREFRVPAGDETFDKVSIGDTLYAENFTINDTVNVTGVSKGKGFQGVVKRHGFSGGKASHGHKDQLRMPGSIGATGPAHVFKGTRMGGQMGVDQVTTTGLKVVDIDADTGILYIKGAVPGPRNVLLQLIAEGELEVIKKDKIKKKEVKPEPEVKTDIPAESSTKPEEKKAEIKTDKKEAKAEELKNDKIKPKTGKANEQK